MDLQSLKIDRSAKPAARRRGNPWPFRLVLLVAAGGACWLFWPLLTQFTDRLRLPEVRTALVAEPTKAAAAAVQGTAANGYVVAARRAALSSDVPGRIVELAVREGSVVKQGDVVARLFADEYRAAWQRTVADLAAAEAVVRRSEAAERASEAELLQTTTSEATARSQCAEAEAQQRWAQLEFERNSDLVRQGIGSPRDQDRAASELDAAKARLAALQGTLATSSAATESAQRRREVAKADIAVAQAQRDVAIAARDLAQVTLDKTDVKAPFDGVVVLKDAEVGEVVSPNVQGGSTARGAVCTMVDFASLEVQANVPETSLASVQLGAPADVFLDAYPNDRYEGKVDRIWPTADRSKATVEVRVKLQAPDDRLRPEYGVRIVFRDAAAPGPVEASATTRAGMVVPETAVVEIAGSSSVFVLERDTVRVATVTAGEHRNGRVVIEAGLRAGQTIVVDPPASLRDGDRVRLAAQ